MNFTDFSCNTKKTRTTPSNIEKKRISLKSNRLVLVARAQDASGPFEPALNAVMEHVKNEFKATLSRLQCDIRINHLRELHQVLVDFEYPSNI